MAPFSEYDSKIKDSEEATEKAYCNEPSEEATDKTYCDEKMAKTTAKKEELQNNVGVAKFRTMLVQDTGQIKKDIRVYSEFAAIAKEQAEMENLQAQGQYSVAFFAPPCSTFSAFMR